MHNNDLNAEAMTQDKLILLIFLLNLRMFENMVLRKIFRLKKHEVLEDGRDCIMRSVMTCIHQNLQVLFKW